MPEPHVAGVLDNATSTSTLSSRPSVSDLWTVFVAQVKHAWRNPVVRRGTYGMGLVGAGSFTPAFLPQNAPIIDQLGIGWMSAGIGRLAATVVLVAGIAMLVDAWLRLRPRVGASPIPSMTWRLWSLPVLFAPPLFSRDAYSYAAQGRIVQEGLDPYVLGPVWVPGPFSDQVDSMWLHTPAPYGPLALQLQHFVVSLTGDNAYVAAVAMRLPALVAVGVIAWGLPRLAERFGASREQAMWLGVVNPLVMMHLIGGSHGDAMMIALVVYALLLASRGQQLWACVAIAGAASFKQTALLALIGVVGMAIHHQTRQPGTSLLREVVAYVRHAGLFGLVAVATFGAITVVSGLGWGWIANLAVPASLRSLLSPPTLVGSIIEWAMINAGMPQGWSALPVPVVRVVALVAGLAVIAWLALRVASRQPVLATAAALLVLCVSSPVVHPWYLLWGGVLLAAVTLSPRVLEGAVWVTLFLVTYGVIDATLSNGTWAIGVTVAVWLALRMRGNRRQPRDPLDSPPHRGPRSSVPVSALPAPRASRLV